MSRNASPDGAPFPQYLAYPFITRIANSGKLKSFLSIDYFSVLKFLMHPFRGGITCSKNILEMYEVDREIYNIARFRKIFRKLHSSKRFFPLRTNDIIRRYDISTVRIITRKAYRNRRNITNNFPSINHYRFLQGLFPSGANLGRSDSSGSRIRSFPPTSKSLSIPRSEKWALLKRSPGVEY